MSTLSKHLFAALMGAVIFSSCSRPVAYFQPSQREHFTSPKTETVATAVTPTEATQPAAAVSITPEAPAVQVAQVKEAVNQVEAYVRNDSKLASNKKLTKRMARVNELLETASQKKTLATTTTSAKKLTMMERVMLKKMDKQIKKHVAPDQKMATSLNKMTIAGIVLTVLGLIIAVAISGLIGLVLLLVGVTLLLLGLLSE